MFEELVERVARVFKLARSDVSRCDLAPDLVLRMRRIASHDVFEVLNRVSVTLLLPCDAAQLVARVDFAFVDLKRALESLTRRIEFASALMNQTEIVMGG